VRIRWVDDDRLDVSHFERFASNWSWRWFEGFKSPAKCRTIVSPTPALVSRAPRALFSEIFATADFVQHSGFSSI
jgi:hypothetical protein